MINKLSSVGRSFVSVSFKQNSNSLSKEQIVEQNKFRNLSNEQKLDSLHNDILVLNNKISAQNKDILQSLALLGHMIYWDKNITTSERCDTMHKIFDLSEKYSND